MSATTGFSKLTVSKKIIPEVADNIIDCSRGIQFLEKKGSITYGEGGDGYQMQTRYANSNIGGATSDFAISNASTTQPFENLTDQFRQYAWKLFLPSFQVARNKNAGPTAKLADLMTNSVNEVKQSASQRLAQAFYSGTGTSYTGDVDTNMNGLSDAIGSTSNTFMGIARSSNTWFQPQVNSTTTFTADASSKGVTDGMQGLMLTWVSCMHGMQTGNDVPPDVTNSQVSPDGILTDVNGWQAVWQSYTPQQRFQNVASPDVMKDLMFMGTPVMFDAYCTSKTFYLCNSKTMGIYFVPDDMLELMIDELPVLNPIGTVWVIGTQCQLWCNKPRYNGKFSFTNI